LKDEKTSKIIRHWLSFLPDHRATFSPNFSENELRMYALFSEIFVSGYEGKYTLGSSSGLMR